MVIGLTGGIASGKSAVSKYLLSKGFPVVDADQVSRDVVSPGSKGLNEIVQAFGSSVLDDGKLNRKMLRNLIFSSDEKRLLLNKILHPIIHEEILSRLKVLKMSHDFVIFEAPLLLENHLEHMVDELWVVASTLEQQITRVMVRDGISKEEAITIIDKQMPLKEKIKKADVVIENNGSLEDLYKQVEQVLKGHQ